MGRSGVGVRISFTALAQVLHATLQNIGKNKQLERLAGVLKSESWNLEEGQQKLNFGIKVFNIEMKESQQQLYLSVKICEHARRLSRDNPLFFLEVYFCNLFYSADIGNGKFHNEHGEYIYIYILAWWTEMRNHSILGYSFWNKPMGFMASDVWWSLHKYCCQFKFPPNQVGTNTIWATVTDHGQYYTRYWVFITSFPFISSQRSYWSYCWFHVL